MAAGTAVGFFGIFPSFTRCSVVTLTAGQTFTVYRATTSSAPGYPSSPSLATYRNAIPAQLASSITLYCQTRFPKPDGPPCSAFGPLLRAS